MANKIIIKKSSVAGKVPAAGDLEVGELAVNLADAKLYSKNASGTVIAVGGGGGAGSGDVVGPVSATDNALARFDGATGKLIQNGTVTQDDSGNVANVLSQSFGDGTAQTVAAGKMWYNATTGSWNMGMGGGNIAQQVGEELFIYGKASAAITEGQVIAKTGTVGASGTITFAPAPIGTTDADLIVGVATENIPLNGFGRVTNFGVVHGIDTSTFTANDTLYYDPTVIGGWTNVKPSAPNIKLEVATVINSGPGGSGSVQVRLGSSSTLGGTDSNVQFGTLSNNDFIVYNGTNSRWENKSSTDVKTTLGLAAVASSGAYSDLTGTPSLATVATTGAYSDLFGTPTLGTAAAANTTDFATASQGTKADSALQPGDIGVSVQAYDADLVSWAAIAPSAKQDTLVSGTNIKTINGNSVLGSGDLTISAGATITFPFYKASGASDPISLVASTYLPFYNSAGAAKNIQLTT